MVPENANDVLINLIASLIYDGIKFGYKLILGNQFDDTHVTPSGRQKGISTTTDAIRRSINKAAIASNSPRVKEFLSSGEVDLIVKECVANALAGFQDSTNTRSIFIESYRNWVPEIDEQQAIKLYDEIIRILELEFENSNSLVDASTYFSGNNSRFSEILTQISNLNERILKITQQSESSPEKIMEFEKIYIDQVEYRHRKILLPSLDTNRRIDIDKIYVNNNFEDLSDRTGRYIDYPFLFSRLEKTVVIGNPGGGKSTLTDRIVVDLARDFRNNTSELKLSVPFHITLRDFGDRYKEEALSISEYLAQSIKSTYQIHISNTSIIEYFLSTGRAVIIFDGIDELLDTSYKQKIRNIIELFENKFTLCKYLITSREIGYYDAPLDKDKFRTFRIKELDDSQVEEYSNKWFSCQDDLTTDEAITKSERFFKESEIVKDIRSNPLMLSLMCSIYRGENYIPQNLADVYEKCATMLFDRWDQRRGIRVALPFEEHVKPTLASLARWIYESRDKGVQLGIPETRLKHKVAEFIIGKRYDDFDSALAAAGEFIGFCKGRAWILTDLGLSHSNESLYGFTHRTFLEYFTALNIVRHSRKIEDLMNILDPKIEKQEWSVINQISSQLYSRRFDDGADEIAGSLLNKIISNSSRLEQADINRLIFLINSLSFLYPSVEIINKIVVLAIEYDGKTYQPRTKKGNEPAVRRVDALRPLLSISSENARIINSCLYRWISEKIEGKSDIDIVSKLLLGIRIGIFNNYWMNDNIRSILQEINTNFEKPILELCPKSFELSYYALMCEIIDYGVFERYWGVGGYIAQTKIFDLDQSEALSSPVVSAIIANFDADYHKIDLRNKNNDIAKHDEVLRRFASLLLRMKKIDISFRSIGSLEYTIKYIVGDYSSNFSNEIYYRRNIVFTLLIFQIIISEFYDQVGDRRQILLSRVFPETNALFENQIHSRLTNPDFKEIRRFLTDSQWSFIESWSNGEITILNRNFERFNN